MDNPAYEFPRRKMVGFESEQEPYSRLEPKQ